jgi:SRSO17 transposase
MRPAELAGARSRLQRFGEDILEPLARRDQRAHGACYLRGLLLDGSRKSVQPMAARLGEIHEQALHHFVNGSPWDWRPIRRRLAERVVPVLGPEAWVVDDIGFRKAGQASVGVHRQYSGTLGKVANCQIGVAVHAVSNGASCPLNWRLFLPEVWNDDAQRRTATRIPASVRHRPKWQLGLDMLDELISWELPPLVIVAEAGYGEVAGFRRDLEDRRLSYVVQVKAHTRAHLAQMRPRTELYREQGWLPQHRHQNGPRTLRELALAVGNDAFADVIWRGRRGTQRSHFMALRVGLEGMRLGRTAGGGELASRWLLVERPTCKPEPMKYWLSNLDADTDLVRLVQLAKLRSRIEQDYWELKDALGLDHFEGRSFPGWHHHVTLVSVAHAFLTLDRLHKIR